MAGPGRNYPALKSYFNEVEMLEQSPRLTKLIPWEVKLYEMKVQDFEWPIEEYECVVGVWCLCYLNCEDQQQLISRADGAVKEGGHLIFFEPVLEDDEE
mgnify:FL=1